MIYFWMKQDNLALCATCSIPARGPRDAKLVLRATSESFLSMVLDQRQFSSHGRQKWFCFLASVFEQIFPLFTKSRSTRAGYTGRYLACGTAAALLTLLLCLYTLASTCEKSYCSIFHEVTVGKETRKCNKLTTYNSSISFLCPKKICTVVLITH